MDRPNLVHLPHRVPRLIDLLRAAARAGGPQEGAGSADVPDAEALAARLTRRAEVYACARVLHETRWPGA